MKKKIVYGLLAILIIIQFFRIDKTNPPINLADDFITITNPPEEITVMLKSACYDCHSHESKYPWYSNIAPVSWWVKHHIDEAREELNFSKWSTFTEKRKDHKFEEMEEEVEEGEMPLKPYPLTHPEAKLSAEQKTQLINWFKATRKAAKEKKTMKTLHLNNGEKWLTNPETSEGIERMLTIINNNMSENDLSQYVTMGKSLNTEMKTIFTECTMQGEGHDQLHLFLIPLVKQFRGLEEASSEDEAELVQKDILKYLNKYSDYFISE